MDVHRQNVNNEQIYESIADCVRNRDPSTSNCYFESNNTVQVQNATNGLRQNTSCYLMPMNVTTAAARRVLKNGTDKLYETVNTVRTKFGTLSQKLRRSTRRRTQLVNSPETPKGRSMLGRTPTKLYSPFSFETPRGKENVPARRSLNRESFKKVTPPKYGFSVRRKVQVENMPGPRCSPRMKNELRDTQIGVYEFHHTADRILRGIQR